MRRKKSTGRYFVEGKKVVSDDDGRVRRQHDPDDDRVHGPAAEERVDQRRATSTVQRSWIPGRAVTNKSG